MRSRQWLISLLLFAASLGFLLYSKYLFPRLSVPEPLSSLPTASVRDAQVVLLANKDYYPFLKQHIQKAQRRIIGTIFLFKTATFRDNEPADLLRALIAARKRNVIVDLVIDLSSEDPDDQAANLKAAELLKDGGVSVRLDSAVIPTHAKAFVIDDRYCFVGSHNLTHSAMAVNEELSIFVDSSEMAFEITKFIHQIPLNPSSRITTKRDERGEE